MSGAAASQRRPGAAVESLALELAPIRVNTVVPCLVDTPLLAGALGDRREAWLEASARRLPVRASARPTTSPAA